MKKNKLIISSLLLLLLLNIFLPISAQARKDITVNVNSLELNFQSPPFILRGTTMVPMREIFEALDADLTWSKEDRSILARKDQDQIYLKIDSPKARVNTREILLDPRPMIRDNKTFVPLRFVSESLGAEVKWDGGKRTIDIWSEIKEDNSPEKVSGIYGKLGNKTIYIGQTLKELEASLGKASRSYLDPGGASWHVFYNSNKNIENYIKVKTRDGLVKGFHTNSKNWVFTGNLRVGEQKSPVTDKKILALESFDKTYVRTYEYDVDKTISFILIEEDSRAPSWNFPRNKLDQKTLDNIEKNIFEYTNVIRVNNGKRPLNHCDSLYASALAYCENMVKKSFFDHVSPDGQTFKERFFSFKRDVDYVRAGENLAGGAYLSTTVVNKWYNSPSHRKVMLEDFTNMAVAGLYNKNSRYKIYFTQHFGK